MSPLPAAILRNLGRYRQFLNLVEFLEMEILK